MTLALRYAVRSDVGLLREGNEDSAYAGPRLLAVADGMGGHAAGEVASAVAISALTDLDGDLPENQLKDALRNAVARANQILHDMVAADPSIGGMGTTLTALLWSGSRVALCHIGDSRAYVLSGGELQQITHDHTLVQSLVDDGRISPDEAATHPQRSLLLRALDGTTDAEPDLFLREARHGDRYLLCSDGLSSVVSEETLHRTLASVAEPDDAVLQLVELAIKGGGPDNITCIVADVVDAATAAAPPSVKPTLAGAASNGAARPMLRTNSPAGRAHVWKQTTPQAPVVLDHADQAAQADEGPPHEIRTRRRWPIVTSILVLLLALIAGGGYAGWRYTQSQYYVGASGGNVAIFQGVNQSVAGIALSHVYRRTTIPLSRVPATDRQSIQAAISASSREDALRIVSNIRSEYRACQRAYTALANYHTRLKQYTNQLNDYKQRYHTTKAVRNKSGKIIHRPPVKPKGPPTIPANCPAPPAGTSTGTGGNGGAGTGGTGSGGTGGGA